MIKKIWDLIPSPDKVDYRFTYNGYRVSVSVNKHTGQVHISMEPYNGRK